MATLKELIVRLKADTSQYQSELDRAGRLGADYSKTMEQAFKRQEAALQQGLQRYRQLELQMQSIQDVAKKMSDSMKLAIGGFTVGGVAKAADDWGQMTSRIHLTLKSIEDSIVNYADIQDRFLKMSNRNSRAIEQAQELYIQSAGSMKELGYSTSQTLDFIETLSNNFTINATSAEKTSGAINALSKSMASGQISALSFRTITTAMPSILNDLSSYLKKSTNDIKALGNAGKIEIDDFANAMIAAREETSKLADSMNVSIGDGMTKISNSFKALVGELNQSQRITYAVSDALDVVSRNFDGVATAAGGLVAVGVARYMGNLSTAFVHAKARQIEAAIATRNMAVAQLEASTVAQHSAIMERRRAQAIADTAQREIAARAALVQARKREELATKALAAAQERAKATALNATNMISRLGSGALGLIGGPVGAAMLAGAGLYYFHEKAEQAKQSAMGLASEVSKLVADYEKMTETTKLNAAGNIYKQLQDNLKRITYVRANINLLEKNTIPYLENQDNIVPFRASRLADATQKLNERKEELEKLQAGAYEAAKAIDKFTKNLDEAQKKALFTGEGVEELNKYLDEANKRLNSVEVKSYAPELRTLEAALNGLAMEMDVATKKGEGLSRQAFILSKLQAALGEKALAYKDALIQVAAGQTLVATSSDGLSDVYNKINELGKQFGVLFDAENRTKSFSDNLKFAEKTAQKYDQQLKQMNEQIALYNKTSNVAKMRYQIENNGLGVLNEQKKQKLMLKAAEIDALDAAKEYKGLMESLESYEESLNRQTKERLEIMNKANLSLEQYQISLKKVIESGAPTLSLNLDYAGDLSPISTLINDQGRLETWQQSQIKMYDEQLQDMKSKHEEHLKEYQSYLKAREEVQIVYEQRSRDLHDAYNVALAQSGQNLAGSMMSIMQQMGDQGSAAYKVLFGMQKSFAVASILMNTEIAAAKAPAEMEVFSGLKMGEAIRALGYANAGLVGGMALAGFSDGGYTGPGGKYDVAGVVHRNEYVIPSNVVSQSGVRPFLDDLKRYGSKTLSVLPSSSGSGDPSSSGSVNNNYTVNVPVTINEDSSISSEDLDAFAKVTKTIVQSEIIRQLRPGGLLNRGK